MSLLRILFVAIISGNV